MAAPPTAGPLPFQQRQRDFATYIRDPEQAALPAGIEAQRMAVYVRLVFNNMESVLANVFATLRDILGRAAWRALVREFLRGHRVVSPYYAQLPDEFLEFLSSRDEAPGLPRFALELCHYDWVRYALPLQPDMPAAAFDDRPIAADDAVAVSALAWPLEYAFPVPDISAARQPSEAPPRPTCLIACRDRHHETRFIASNRRTLRLLALIGEASVLADALTAFATETGTTIDRVVGPGLQIANSLHAHDVLVRPT